ncbi:CsbD family protein [Thalassobaculum salexigens]|uniref:CsbD family protein n=1 Tax=Thalassobaculum salexigens TaxID=455360 RepID=UPI00041F8F0A|nr:CsbD family protein [Thalassobaculum salexigens]
MNWDQIKGNWKSVKGKAQQQWGDLTNDELDKVEGSQTELEGLIQQRYGKSREEAKQEVRDWADRI